MFAFKKNYFLLIESTKDLDLKKDKNVVNLLLFIGIIKKRKNIKIN